jgi:pilus assembly protein CpaB
VLTLLERSEAGADDQVTEDVETVTVVAASRTLYQGVHISSKDLFVVNVPPDYLPVVTDAEAMTKTSAKVFSTRERVVGQVPRERILKNEFIRPERLADGAAGVGLNAVIPRGMRAVSLEIRGADAITGFLEAGNYADILVTLQDELGRSSTETLLQAVFVLGVDSKAENEDEADKAARGKQRPSITFLVTPRQAEQLVFADQMGSVSLALRNVQDVNYHVLGETDLNKLLGHYRPAIKRSAPVSRVRTVVPVDVPRNGQKIDIIRGAVKVTIDADNVGKRPLKIP